MKDRLQDANYLSSHASIDAAPLQSDEAVKALEALGYKPQEANKIIQKLDDGQKTCEQLIREALQSLAIR
jgi:Holliday junction DNA helicase RuvA